MTAFARKCQRAVFIAIETHSQFDQVRDFAGAFFDERAHRVNVAQPGAGSQCVVDVFARAVIFGEYRRNSTLRPFGVRSRQFILRKKDDLAMLGRRECRAQSGDSATDDQGLAEDRGHQLRTNRTQVPPL